MQTKLADNIKTKPEQAEIEHILRACVHCGFCNATCPTYQLTGDELDSPRGRIYLLKQVFEGEKVSQITQRHLDRCLSCRSCETTCPSDVEYGRLLDLGRIVVDENVARSFSDQLMRQMILLVFPYRQRFKRVIQFARWSRALLPKTVREKIPVKQRSENWTNSHHSRKIVILPGCVQPTLAPEIDLAAAKVLDKLGISLISLESSACCGALNYHLSAHEKAKALARNNIDACWSYIEQGVEAITMTASGCGLALKEYATILQYDRDYAIKAKRFSALVKDLGEIIRDEDLSIFQGHNIKVAYQSPCTLQHGQKLPGVVESILQDIGCELVDVDQSHICCGSAGVYSLLQTALSEQLRDQKLEALQTNHADCIATANIGCLTHLQAKTSIKVMHWIMLLDEK